MNPTFSVSFRLILVFSNVQIPLEEKIKGKQARGRKERTEKPFEFQNARSFNETDKLECQHEGALENLINSDIKFTPKWQKVHLPNSSIAKRSLASDGIKEGKRGCCYAMIRRYEFIPLNCSKNDIC